MPAHTHNCCRCGHEFNCHWKGRKDTSTNCKTFKATKVNWDGPYCALCLHLEMALRYATHRKLENISASLRLCVSALNLADPNSDILAQTYAAFCRTWSPKTSWAAQHVARPQSKIQKSKI